MKKIILSLALVFSCLMANAQMGIVNPEVYDNVYFGANIGANTNLAGNKFFPVNTTINLRLGKDISPIFGVNVEATAWLGSTIEHRNRFDLQPIAVQAYDEWGDPMYDSYGEPVVVPVMSKAHNLIRSFNLGINSTVNLTNLFMGYLGEPRQLEVSSIIGLGWGHNFTPSHPNQYQSKEDRDFLTAKTGLDIAYNFGDEQQHQLYMEPAILWNLNKDGYSGIQMNKHGAFLQLAVGYNYKFGCSYGGHNFKFIGTDRSEIDRLNRLLEECNNRPPKIEYVEKIVYRDGETKTISIDNLKVVTFEQGKDYLTDDAKSDLNRIKAGSHVQVIGTASPEGSEERNQQLSNNRANVVAEYLESRGVIVDSKEGRGVEGKTSNRLAIVYVVK